MQFLVALLTLVFARPDIQPVQGGVIRFNEKPGAFYYVISSEGAFRVEKQKAQRAPKNFHPAFIFSSETRFRISMKPVENDGVTVASNQVRYSDGFVVRKGKSSSSSHEVDAALSVQASPSGDEYLLVKWRSEPAQCEFTLFRIEADTVVEASRNQYSCGPR